MKKFIIGFGWIVSACAAVAETGASNEFRLDTRRVKIARATEPISYSTAWATNLTAGGDAGGATHEIKADYDIIANREFCVFGKVEGK